MRMYDIIRKKRDGGTHTAAEIQFLIDGVTGGTIPDEQTAAWLMAVYYRGMTPEETAALTLAMAHSGERVDLSGIQGVKVDKHSTGGVGDKTTLVVVPIVAACGVKAAKMSGRGLGHTGGTIDKLSAIPGFTAELPREIFMHIVDTCGACVIAQSAALAPADKKLYALRDVTGTVESLPLIAASIMSKKLAAGADCILLDVKTGSGAFMKTQAEAEALAKIMVETGERAGKNTAALITEMDRPLGYAIGNAPEVMEAVAVLRGCGPADLHEICMQLSAHMLWQAGKGTLAYCRTRAEYAVTGGAAYQKLVQMVAAQGGDPRVWDDPEKFTYTKYTHTVTAPQSGYICHMDTACWGAAAVQLGAGRETQKAPIDYAAGITLRKKTGDFMQAGETLAILHTNREAVIQAAAQTALSAVTFSADAPPAAPLIRARVDKFGCHALYDGV